MFVGVRELAAVNKVADGAGGGGSVAAFDDFVGHAAGTTCPANYPLKTALCKLKSFAPLCPCLQTEPLVHTT